jgi:hypothetical protein
MPIIMPHETWVVNDTQFAVALSLNRQYPVEIRPGDSGMIREFDTIEVKAKMITIRLGPDEKVEIGHQAPENSISLKSPNGFSFTLSYRASATEVRTIRFGN